VAWLRVVWSPVHIPHRTLACTGLLTRYARSQPVKPGVRCRPEKESKIVQNSAGETVADILKRKKASIKQAPLPSGSPDWDTFMQMTWEHIEEGARANRLGFKVVRKLLTDKRFDK